MLNSPTEENNIRPYDFNMLNDQALEKLDMISKSEIILDIILNILNCNVNATGLILFTKKILSCFTMLLWCNYIFKKFPTTCDFKRPSFPVFKILKKKVKRKIKRIKFLKKI